MSTSNITKAFKAKYIVVWCDEEHQVLEDGYISIKDGLIEGYGKRLPDGIIEVDDLGDVLLAPGFINLYCHPSGAPIQNSFIEDTGSVNFYQSALFEQGMVLRYSEEEAEDVARFTLTELLLSGCTTIVDPGCSISETVVKLAGDMGLRAYIAAAYRSGLWRTEDGHSLIHPLDEETGLRQISDALE